MLHHSAKLEEAASYRVIILTKRSPNQPGVETFVFSPSDRDKARNLYNEIRKEHSGAQFWHGRLLFDTVLMDP